MWWNSALTTIGDGDVGTLATRVTIKSVQWGEARHGEIVADTACIGDDLRFGYTSRYEGYVFSIIIHSSKRFAID